MVQPVLNFCFLIGCIISWNGTRTRPRPRIISTQIHFSHTHISFSLFYFLFWIIPAFCLYWKEINHRQNKETKNGVLTRWHKSKEVSHEFSQIWRFIWFFFPLHLLKERKYDSISQRRNPKLKKQSEKKRATFFSLNHKLKTIPGNSLPNIAHENY